MDSQVVGMVAGEVAEQGAMAEVATVLVAMASAAAAHGRPVVQAAAAAVAAGVAVA